MCIDETHLFLEHGHIFPTDFKLLKSKLFPKLKGWGNQTMTLVLLMIDAFDFDHESLLEKTIGMILINDNVFWA